MSNRYWLFFWYSVSCSLVAQAALKLLASCFSCPNVWSAGLVGTSRHCLLGRWLLGSFVWLGRWAYEDSGLEKQHGGSLFVLLGTWVLFMVNLRIDSSCFESRECKPKLPPAQWHPSSSKATPSKPPLRVPPAGNQEYRSLWGTFLFKPPHGPWPGCSLGKCLGWWMSNFTTNRAEKKGTTVCCRKWLVWTSSEALLWRRDLACCVWHPQ